MDCPTFFYGYYNVNTGVFYQTNAKRITDRLITEMINSTENMINSFREINEFRIMGFRQSLRKARMEIKKCSRGYYVDISGDGFGGYGTDGIFDSIYSCLDWKNGGQMVIDC